MFQNLQPSREYEVSVAMRNAEGEGPRAYMTVATPPLPTSELYHYQKYPISDDDLVVVLVQF